MDPYKSVTNCVLGEVVDAVADEIMLRIAKSPLFMVTPVPVTSSQSVLPKKGDVINTPFGPQIIGEPPTGMEVGLPKPVVMEDFTKRNYVTLAEVMGQSWPLPLEQWEGYLDAKGKVSTAVHEALASGNLDLKFWKVGYTGPKE